MSKFTTVGKFKFKTPFEFSLQRQRAVLNRYGSIYPELSKVSLIICCVVPSLRRLLQSYKSAMVLVDEKTRKLADSDAQVSNLANANLQWMALAKKRKDILKRHKLTDES